jgi:hypothetical protein
LRHTNERSSKKQTDSAKNKQIQQMFFCEVVDRDRLCGDDPELVFSLGVRSAWCSSDWTNCSRSLFSRPSTRSLSPSVPFPNFTNGSDHWKTETRMEIDNVQTWFSQLTKRILQWLLFTGRLDFYIWNSNFCIFLTHFPAAAGCKVLPVTDQPKGLNYSLALKQKANFFFFGFFYETLFWLWTNCLKRQKMVKKV